MKTRMITDKELRQLYGEEHENYITFDNVCGEKMIQVYYLTAQSIAISFVFSALLPVDENDEIIDPTKPKTDSIAEYEQNGYKIKAGSLIGGSWGGLNELCLTASEPDSVLKIYEVSRIDGGDMPRELFTSLVVSEGYPVFKVNKTADDHKSTTVCALMCTYGRPEDLSVELKVYS